MSTRVKVPDDLSFGDFIRVHRLGEEMTQAEMAEVLGISKQRVCDIEKDRYSPSIKFAKVVAMKLEFSPEYLAMLAIRDQIKKEGLNLKVN